jgi:CheY-like chemotaxis protein
MTQPPPPVPRRILIVDDSEDGAESLALLLELAGHETHKAHDGLAAVEAAERVRPDAILLDIGLPKINGYEACRRIRNQPWGKHIVLVALTGWGQDEDRQQAQEAGFDVHMVKPVDHDALMEFLTTVPSVRKQDSGINR